MRGALLVLAMVLFSGCSGGKGGNGNDDSPDEDEAPANVGPNLPDWAVGDYWQYSSPFGDTDYVVTGDQGADWFLDTTNEETAFFNTRTDISRLGEVRKSDLAGSQGNERVEFFKWPLTANATWTTTWDGNTLDIRVEEVSATRASMSATNASGGLVYAYVYDAEVRWYESITSYLPDGTEAFTLQIMSYGHNFTGEVVRWSYETIEEFSGTGPSQQGAAPFEVAAGVTDLWVSYSVECEVYGGFTMAVVAPTHEWHAGDDCPGSFSFAGVIREEPPAGNWLYAYEWGGDGSNPPSGSFELLARTLEKVPVG